MGACSGWAGARWEREELAIAVGEQTTTVRHRPPPVTRPLMLSKLRLRAAPVGSRHPPPLTQTHAPPSESKMTHAGSRNGPPEVPSAGWSRAEPARALRGGAPDRHALAFHCSGSCLVITCPGSAGVTQSGGRPPSSGRYLVPAWPALTAKGAVLGGRSGDHPHPCGGMPLGLLDLILTLVCRACGCASGDSPVSGRDVAGREAGGPGFCRVTTPSVQSR